MMKFDLQRFADLTITKGGTYNVNESNSTVTIATTEAVTLTGNADTQLSEVVISTTADNADLTIDNLNIANDKNPIITVGDGAENKLNITGENTLEVKSGPGACVNIGGGLTVNGTGSLKGTSINSAVIGINGTQSKPDSDITIESGTFNLTCRSGACAIGGAGARGNAVGNITITGTANITASAPGGHAATIGASYWGTCGDITINGDAKITATSGQHSSAIGGASLTSVGNITINGNAEVNAINASQVDDSAAIGSGLGSMVQSLGNIVIGGNAKVTATSNLGLAIDNIEYYRNNQQYGTTNEGDYYLDNEDTVTIGENATFTGHSGDIYTKTTINGTEFKAAEISYNSTDGLLYSGGSELDKEALEETLLEIKKGGSYTIAEGSVGKILINTTDAVTLQGGDYDLEEIQIIAQSDNIDLTINDLKITNKAVAASVIHFGSGADNKLTINGANDFSIVKGNKAGINIGGGGTIGGTGSIKIETLSGAAIGTDGEQDLSSSNITIDSGTFDLMTRSGACGIGCAGNGSKIGNITITGTAHVVSKTPQGYAAAIGSAYRGTVGDILINGDATVEATSGLQTAAIGSAVYCKNGNITIGGRASVVANTTSTDVKDAAIGGTYGEQVNSIGDINIIEDATVIANSAHGLALDNRLFVETGNYVTDYWTVNADSTISISGDTSTPNQSTVILTNGNTSDIATIGGKAYQGGKVAFYDGNLAMTGNWTSLESGGWGYSSVVQMDYLQKNRDDKSAQFTLKGGNLKDEDGDGRPDNVSVGSILYVQQSGVHTNIRNLSGNVVYNGDALGIEGDDSYNIEAVSPIDLSEKFPLDGYYITDANVTAIRAVSNGATISPRGTAGTETAADWISFDNEGGTVTFKDGSYCLYTEKQFFSRAYTKVAIANNNEGVEITTGDDLIKTIGNLQDGYEITIESGINVGEKIDFKTSGSGVIVVKTTANSGKYSLDADSDEWQYQRFTLGGDSEFTFAFGENGSVVGMENFEASATIQPAGNEILNINNKLYQGDEIIFQNGNLVMTGNWTSLKSGGWGYSSVVQMDYLTNLREDKTADFTISGGNLKDEDGDGRPDNVSVGSILYVQQSGTHTNIRNLSGNVIYNGDALGIEGDDSYNIEAVSPIDLSEKFPLEGYYITDANVTAIRAVSDGATISPRGTAGTETAADWISFDNEGGTVTFKDGSYCLYTEKQFFSRAYTKVAIANNNEGVEITTGDDLIKTIGNLQDGYEITIESGINVGEKIDFKTSGSGVIVVKTTANSGKYSLDADSDEWQYQRFTLGSDDEFTFVFGENGSVVGMEGFDATLQTDDTSLFKGEWVTLAGGGFEYTGNATNNPSKWATFTVSGASITSTDNLTVTNNVYMEALGGNRIGLLGLNGNASIDGVEMKVDGDTLYAGHFTKSEDGIDANSIAVLNISDSATVDNNYSAGTDKDGRIDFTDGLHTVFTNEYLPTRDFTSINADNNEDGFSLNVKDGTFDEISGLNNGFAISVTTGGNIGDELAFKTDGGQGTVAVQYGGTSAKFNVGGDSAFGVKFNSEDNSVELVDYEGWQPVSDGVYKYASDKTNFTISGEDFDPNVAKVTYNVYVPILNSSRIEILGLNGNVTINGVETGVYNDKNYGIHAQVSVDSPDVEMISASEVSDGASISNAANGVRIDDDAEVNFADGTYQLQKKNHNSQQEDATITVDNGGAGFNVKVVDDAVKTLGGLVDGFNVTLKPSVTVGDELTIKTDGKSGTLNVGETTLEVDGDKEFSILLNDERDIAGLKNFEGNSTITGGGSNATLAGGSGDDLLLAGTAINMTMTGGAGNDTFKGGANLAECVITDYTEGEDVITHGRPFADMSINGSIVGSDYVFDIKSVGKKIIVKDAADKVITVVDANGDERLFGKYLTLDDNDPATVTAQDGVATIDASARTKDIEVISNDGNNTIISSAGNCTLTGGEGKDTFVRGSRTAEQTIVVADFTENEDEVYHGKPFAEFSLLDIGKADGDDYVFEAGTATIKYLDGANKKLKFVDVNGDVAYFGNYLTIRDFDSDTVTATEKVKVLDASERTTDVELIDNSGNNTIYGGTGNDLIVYNGGNDVIKGFTANDTLSIASGKYSSEKSGNDLILSVGDDSITLEDAATLTNPNIIGTKEISIKDIIKGFTPNNSSIVSAEDTGKEDISLTGGDLAVVEKTGAKVSIVTSKSTDTVVSEGDNVTVNLNSGGNTWLFVPEGKMTLEGYNDTTGAGFNDTYDDILSEIAEKIVSKEIVFDDGKLSMGTAVVSFGDVTDEIVNFYDAQDNLQKVGFASNDATIDTSNQKYDLILVGGTASTILGGDGNDTVYAGKDSFVDAGAGKNQIYLETKSETTIALAVGRNTINNFNATFDDGDKVSVDAADFDLKFDGENVSVKSGNGKAVLQNISSAGEGFVKLLTVAKDKEIKAAIAQADSIIAVGNDTVDLFVGNKSGVDFTGFESSLLADLGDSEHFRGINQVTAGDGHSSLIGSSGRETLNAGTNYTSIWGGAGNDVLQGNTSADKDANTEFFFQAGDGKDVVKDFEFLTDENALTADKINVGSEKVTNVVVRNSGDVMLKVGNAEDWLTIENAQGKKIKVNDLVAIVDKTALEFDDEANYYVATGNRATLTVGSNVEDEAIIWLGNPSRNGSYFVGDIRTIDATDSTVKTELAGNDLDNTICAGKGDASLWGGNGGNDLLVGGSGNNMFFYTTGNGNDTIEGVNDGDVVYLSQITFENVAGTDFGNNSVAVNFKDGGKLTINDGGKNVGIVFGDQTYYVNNARNGIITEK